MAAWMRATLALGVAALFLQGALARPLSSEADAATQDDTTVMQVTLFTPQHLENPTAARKLLQTYYSGSGPYYNISVQCGSWSVSTPWSNSSGTYQSYRCHNTTSNSDTTGTVSTSTATWPGGSSTTTTSSNGNGGWGGTSVNTPYSSTQVTCGSTSVSTPWYSGSWSYPGCGRRKLLAEAARNGLQPADVTLMLPSKTADPRVSRALLTAFYEAVEAAADEVACSAWKVVSEFSDESGAYTGYNCTTQATA